MMDSGLKIPLNRFVAFVKPGLNLLAAGIAAWLVAKANVLGIPGLDEANTATWIAAGLTGLLTQGALQIGDLKWLKGHHITIEADAAVTAAALAPVAPEVAIAELTETLHDPEVDVADGDVSDEEEFASPPPDGPTSTPVQPSQDG